MVKIKVLWVKVKTAGGRNALDNLQGHKNYLDTNKFVLVPKLLDW